MLVELHDRLDDLLPEWETLFAADPGATPFVSPGWAAAWWRHWSDSTRPWIATVHDRGELVGLAPLVVRRRGPLRVMHVLGKEPGDYWDVLALPSAREQATTAVAREIARRHRDWDIFVLDCLPQGSITERSLVAAGLRARRRRAVPCPGIELPGTFEEYLARLPQKRRTNLRRHLRSIDEGEVELRDVRGQQELTAAIDRWHELHVRRWDQMGRQINPEHRDRRFRDFMLDAVSSLVPAGLALVWEFRRAGEVVGVYVNFVDDRTFYLYLGGFDASASTLGVGKIAIAEGIRSSIAAGRTYFDFTRGGERYKHDEYGATSRYSPSLVLANGRPWSCAALVATAARDRLRGSSARVS